MRAPLKSASLIAFFGTLLSGGLTHAASVYIVHGIPGQDLGLDPSLPVDVSVNGNCAVPNFQFGNIVGPVDLPGGSYDIAISLANADTPCSSEAVISAPGVALEDDASYSIVANLTEAGDGVTANVFLNDVTTTQGARVTVHHTAAAPAVDVLAGTSRRLRVASPLTNLTNGTQGQVDLRSGHLSVAVAPAGAATVVHPRDIREAVVFGPTTLNLAPRTAYLVFAVGSLANQTFTLLVQDIDVAKAEVFVFHGIVGDDLGLGTTLPVDVSVNGACALKGLEFSNFVGPIALDPGSYDIAIGLADAAEPCSAAPVIEANGVALTGGSAIIAAHLSEAGAPTASVFPFTRNNRRFTSRLFVHHTAVAPTVDAGLQTRFFGRALRARINGLANGNQAQADVIFGHYQASLFPAGTDTRVLGPTSLPLQRGQTYAVFAVGSLSNNTLQFVVNKLPR